MFFIRISLKQGDALSPLLFNFALDYAIRSIQVIQDVLKLNGTHQIHANDVNILGESIHIIRENAEALVVASKEIRLEAHADKTKYMVMSQDQNAKRCHSMKTDNNFFKSLEEFNYLRTTLSSQNSIQEEIKSRLKSRIACYHSVQNLLSSSLLSKHLKIKIYRTIILPVVYLWV
jgi:hypothetical protein